MGNLAGWPYWKVISVTGQAGAGTDYQVKLTIGDSAGGDFHLEGHCTNFPQDIRITDDDGTTLLDHFVEDLTADPIIVHVEVKDDLGSNQDIRVYYGKNGETTVSNISNTFLIGDDFENDSIGGEWTKVNEDASRILSEASGKFTATVTSYNCDWWSTGHTTPSIYQSIPLSDNYEIVTKMDSNPDAKYNGAGIVVADSTNLVSGVRLIRIFTTGNTNKLQSQYLGGNIAEFATSQTTNIKLKIRKASDWYFYHDLDGGGWDAIGSRTQTISNNIVGLYAGTAQASGSHSADFHYVYAKKYNSPEPAFSSAGAEQTSGVGIAPTGVFYGPLVGPFGGPI